MKRIHRYNPAVSVNLLILLAGLAWLCVGTILLFTAISWLSTADESVNPYFFAGAGFFVALVVHHFGFLRIVDKNLVRILPSTGKKCLFSFIPWKSYVLIAVMMALGALLRQSPIPGHYLAICYIGIGLALILSSLRYMRVFLAEMQAE